MTLHQFPPNARFWVSGPNGSPVKITLRPDEILSHFHRWDNGEGVSKEWRSWAHDNGAVLLEQYTSSTDCDGPLSTEREAVCQLGDLAKWKSEDQDVPGWPDWKWGRSSQRDAFAEAAGY